MMGKLRIGIIGCVVSCLTLPACTGGNGSYVTGFKVGLDRSHALVDIDAHRVEVIDVVSAQNFPIPETLFFEFSMSPAAYAARFEQNNRRRPTQEDWARQRQLSFDAQDWSRVVNVESSQAELRELWDRLEQDDQTTEYPRYVAGDGWLRRECDGGANVGGRKVCWSQTALSDTLKRQLAQAALDQLRPGCRLGTIDPEAVTSLPPNYTSRARSLLVTILCG